MVMLSYLWFVNILCGFVFIHADESFIVETYTTAAYLPSTSNTLAGQAIAGLGDLSGDGVIDLAITVPAEGSSHYGAVYILYLNSDGSWSSYFSFNPGDIGFTSSDNAQLGMAAARIGDIDSDGYVDLAVSSIGEYSSSPYPMGCVHLVSLSASDISAYHLISGTEFGVSQYGDLFGRAIISVGDWDGNGYDDLLVGAPGVNDSGCVYFVPIDAGELDVTSNISFKFCASDVNASYANQGVNFGFSLAYFTDGLVVVGVPYDGAGAVWLVNISNWTIQSAVKLDTRSLSLDSSDAFGQSVTVLRDGLTAATSTFDLDRDAYTIDIAVGAPYDDDEELNSGAVYILHVYPDGSIQRSYKLSTISFLGRRDHFGASITCFGDLDSDGEIEVAVGMPGYQKSSNRGGGWATLFLNPTAFPTPSPTSVPSHRPTPSPTTIRPTDHPTLLPTAQPTMTSLPTLGPTYVPSSFPTRTFRPSQSPSHMPTVLYPTSTPTTSTFSPSPTFLTSSPAPTQFNTHSSYFLTAATIALWGTTFFVICTLGLWTCRLAVCKPPDPPDLLADARGAIVAPRQAEIEPIQLPSIPFEQSSASQPGKDTTCSICLCDMCRGEVCKELPSCHHVFHSECIEEWLNRSHFCPLCKQSLLPPPQAANVSGRTSRRRGPPRAHVPSTAASRELEMREFVRLHSASL